MIGIRVHSSAYRCIQVHTGAYQFSLILYHVGLLGILVHISLSIFVHARQFHFVTCSIICYVPPTRCVAILSQKL